ncbi:MAG: 5'-methylthioadenosine/adenosylhomocysteine nucleosidase [Planctomycetes bacterium]|jgi:adenosylhomocysteine nucleosidase|nr:5'-methylthioadenosine/adenosylhomocysteine nucleosidase [Planctomycetota bacterium]
MKRCLFVMVWLALALLPASCTTPAQHSPRPAPLAVLGAFQQEVTLLREMLTEVQVRPIEGIEFISGRIGTAVVVVAWTGVGKVNAAMTTTLLLEHFRPRQVIFTGIAGGIDPNLEPGDIIVAKQTAYHDAGTLWTEGIEYGGVRNRFTGEYNPVFFPADPELLAVAEQAGRALTFEATALRAGHRPPRVVVGTVVTGDVFVVSKERSAEFAAKLGAHAVEMEGAAVAQVCYQRDVGCLVIRSISDKADEEAIMDKQLFYAMAARNSAGLVVEMVRTLTRGSDVE